MSKVLQSGWVTQNSYVILIAPKTNKLCWVMEPQVFISTLIFTEGNKFKMKVMGY